MRKEDWRMMEGEGKSEEGGMENDGRRREKCGRRNGE